MPWKLSMDESGTREVSILYYSHVRQEHVVCRVEKLIEIRAKKTAMIRS